MIRFAWLQARTQSVVAAGIVLVVAIGLAVTGPHLLHLYDSTVATCRASNDCRVATASFLRNDGNADTQLGALVLLAPALLGIFWGAPMVAREIEGGSFRLAFTQSITRTRWLAAKLAVVGLASVVAAGLLSLAVTWWARPLDHANANLYGTFDQRGIVPLGYAAFCFALGVTAGLVIRRTLPAMAATLVAFVGARLAVTHLIRPHLLTPIRLAGRLDPASTGYTVTNGGPGVLVPDPPSIPNTWIYSTRIVDGHGHPLTAAATARACPDLATVGPPAGASPNRSSVPANVQATLVHCVDKLSPTYHTLIVYQPASRYWALQWSELAIFVGLALALTGLCFWLIRRHLP